MSNYILLPNGNTVRDDELYHWKYTRREKVNGKWRYYYDDYYVDEGEDYTPPSERPIGQQYYGPEDMARREEAISYAKRQSEKEEKVRAEQEHEWQENTDKVERLIRTAADWVDSNLDRIVRNREYYSWEDAKHNVKQKFPGLFD